MGAVAPPIFMLEFLQDGTFSVPLSNPAFLRAGKQGRRTTRQSVVQHFLTIRVIHPSKHKSNKTRRYLFHIVIGQT